MDFSASRAYYALFYIAEAFLIEQGLSYSSHAAVISAFGKLFAKTGKVDPRFHRYLLDAQDTRNIGDYSIGPGVTEEQAKETLSWAVEFLDTAETFFREIDHPQLLLCKIFPFSNLNEYSSFLIEI